MLLERKRWRINVRQGKAPPTFYYVLALDREDAEQQGIDIVRRINTEQVVYPFVMDGVYSEEPEPTGNEQF
jgi:hypothetical protein